MKHSFLDPHIIDHITMYAYLTYISSAIEYFRNSRMLFDHIHVIKMMNDTLGRRNESRINAILKHTGYKWLKNYSDLNEKESDRLLSIKKSDLQTAHAYHFRIAMLRIRKVNITIDESYLKKWISWASRSRMPDIVNLGKTIKRHLGGILEAVRSTINSAVVEGLNNKICTAFKRSYVLKAGKYRDTIIFLVAGGLKSLPGC